MENNIKRKMFFEVLPKWETGSNKGKINWIKSIGYSVHFIFHEIEGDIKIVGCIPNQQLIIFEYKNCNYDLQYESFKNCVLSKMFEYKYRDGKSERQLKGIKKREPVFKYEVGTKFQDDITNIIIIDREFRIIENKNGGKNNKQYYKCHCNICGYENWKSKACLNNSKPRCSNCRKIVSEEKRKLSKPKSKKNVS